MYLNIGNNQLIDEKEVVAVLNPKCISISDLEKMNLEDVEVLGDVRSVVITDTHFYLSNLSADYINKKTRKEII